MKKTIDSIGFDEDGRLNLDGFAGDIFGRIKALVVVIADDNSQASDERNSKRI